MTLKEIKRTLKTEGECKIGNIEIVLDGIGECEITKDNQYEFTTTNWYEVEDYLIEEGIISE